MDSTFVLSIYTMLKKTGYIALATLLILTTVGFVISRHYCNGELVSVQVDIPADNCCDEDADNCCHNENETFILKVDFTQPISDEVNLPGHNLYGGFCVGLLTEVFQNRVTKSLVIDGHPPETTADFLAKIQSFLL